MPLAAADICALFGRQAVAAVPGAYLIARPWFDDCELFLLLSLSTNHHSMSPLIDAGFAISMLMAASF